MAFPLPEVQSRRRFGLDPRPLDRLCATIEQHVAEGHQPGAQLAVARHGKLALFRSFGRRPRRHADAAADARSVS